MDQLIKETQLPVYVLTTNWEGRHYGMTATWVCKASLRSDELRLTVPLSKYNQTTKAILASQSFLLHLLPPSAASVAFTFGAFHSEEVDKFEGLQTQLHATGSKVLNVANRYGWAQVISTLETEDRIIVYCSIKEVVTLKNKIQLLTSERFFEQLDSAQKSTLHEKFKSNSDRDAKPTNLVGFKT